ncbi:uncharacterized protein PHACADRAFT_33657 [Phanerochaete carnosa HHB-10118-sp]|uniref:Uncharacterized protein n=1 Tax=Phanerochaete carnosa (strain HHB-10118-sp) TaxID=650164 RepID=K5VD15_PHACS|nr:uncharacterized protein PHACADRAFT_33657 [Phanerochaete carnosa HHB-10118-sp]EKM49013.1 hypothetical protein PHACADRAFT_33657 [Phanerochaete carnosa HHB-10118-sp]
MARGSIAAHLKTQAHHTCAEDYAQHQARATAINQRLQREDLATTQTIHLRAVNIVQAGIPDGQGGGAEEARMWESFDADADRFTFGAGQGPEALAARAEHHWERELRDFELSEDWARESAEDDWLAEILGDISRCNMICALL